MFEDYHELISLNNFYILGGGEWIFIKILKIFLDQSIHNTILERIFSSYRFSKKKSFTKKDPLKKMDQIFKIQ